MKDYGIRLDRFGHTAVVTFDRPIKKNTFDRHMWDCLMQVTADLRKKLPRAVILTGAGDKAFSAGFDVNPENPLVASLADAVQKHEKGPAMELINLVRTTTDNLMSLPVPVIGAINGLAYGGGAEIACRCDLKVMDPDAVICFSEVKIGLMPDHGGLAALTRLLGPSRAADLILTAREIKAAEARELGLVNRISRKGKALEESLALAGAIAENGPQAVRHALKVIRQAQGMSMSEALALETQAAVDLIASSECLYGISAFLARQKPEFPDIDD